MAGLRAQGSPSQVTDALCRLSKSRQSHSLCASSGHRLCALNQSAAVETGMLTLPLHQQQCQSRCICCLNTALATNNTASCNCKFHASHLSQLQCSGQLHFVPVLGLVAAAMFAVMMHVYTVILLYNTCTAVKIELLFWVCIKCHKMCSQSCHVDAHDQLQPCRPLSSRGHHRWIPFIAYATGASALGKSVSLLSHAHWIFTVGWISWINSSEVHAQQSVNHVMFAKHCVGSNALTIED